MQTLEALESLNKIGLGDDGNCDPDRIAAYLEKEKIKGSHSAYSCPVAVYLHRETDIEHTVTPRAIWETSPDEQLHEYPTPNCVGRFITKFDSYEYKRLEKGDSL